MDWRHKCPICVQFLVGNIYQCKEGHIVCDVCFGKLERCPTCQIPFQGFRNRALENELDQQLFECEFKHKCDQTFKRTEIINHVNSCYHNPDLIPLCKLLGSGDCVLRLGGCSNSAVISHFKEKHGTVPAILDENGFSNIKLDSILTEINAIRHNDLRTAYRTVLCHTSEELSPLFIIIGKFEPSINYMSFICIQISESERALKYKIEFAINRDVQSPHLLGWALDVYTLEQGRDLLTKCAWPIITPITILEQGLLGQGQNMNGFLNFRVSLK